MQPKLKLGDLVKVNFKHERDIALILSVSELNHDNFSMSVFGTTECVLFFLKKSRIDPIKYYEVDLVLVSE